MQSTHPYFTPAVIDRLCRPERWQLISGHCPEAVPPAEHAAHAAWMAAHTHQHAHLEVLFILDGGGWYGYRGHVYPCAPGTVFFFDAFEPHDENCPAFAPDADHLWVSLTREHAIARVVPIRSGRLLFPAERGLLLPSAVTLFEVASAPPPVRRLKILAALGVLFTGIIEEGYAVVDPEDSRLFHQRLIATIQQHIRDTAGRGASLDHLARMAGYSKYHFLRLFKVHTGQSVHQFIDTCRYERVRQLLGEGMSNKAIAHVLGFSCPAAFSRWLRGSEGIPPHREK